MFTEIPSSALASRRTILMFSFYKNVLTFIVVIMLCTSYTLWLQLLQFGNSFHFPLVVVLVGFVSLLIKELKQLLLSMELRIVLCLLKKLYMAIIFFFVIFIPAGSGASGHSASWGRTTQPTSPPYESHLHSLVSNITVFIQIKH